LEDPFSDYEVQYMFENGEIKDLNFPVQKQIDLG
jgi:hypothetical protein